MRPIKVLAMAAVWAIPAMIGYGLGMPAHSGGGPTEAPTGFEVASNGFAEEFCANQEELAEDPQLAGDPRRRVQLRRRRRGVHRARDGRRRAGADLQRRGLWRVPHRQPRSLGRHQPDRREARWLLQPRPGCSPTIPGGSLIQDRSFRPTSRSASIPAARNVIALRNTLSVLGDGFVEAIGNNTLQDIANNQPPISAASSSTSRCWRSPGTTRFGRFGHKGQQASLVSFSADAYLNEMGITSPLQPTEHTSNGGRRRAGPPSPGVDDEGVDVELFALFMRSTKAPPVDAVRAARPTRRRAARSSSDRLRHVPHADHRHRPPGTLINGGALRVANALGEQDHPPVLRLPAARRRHR